MTEQSRTAEALPAIAASDLDPAITAMELARVSFVFAVTVILFVILVLHTTDQIAAATGTASASSGLCAQNAIARPELVLDSSYLILKPISA